MADELDPAVATWLAGFAARLGTEPPSDAEIEVLLRLASVAARGSARQAAPVACWLAARAGVDPERALQLAES